jgi:hypothetical protein
MKNNNALKRKHCKDKYLQCQFKVVYKGFFEKPQTMKELSVEINIDRANICRYCRTLRQRNQIAVVKKVYCSITKHLANQYTTNPALFRISSQLKIF